MPRPKKTGPMIPVRLSLDAYAVLEGRATAKGKSVREHLVEQLEKSLAPVERMERNKIAVKMERPPRFEPDVDTVVPLGSEVSGELVVPAPLQEATDNEPKLGPHPSWRVNAIGMNVCTVCGEPKVTNNRLCPGPQ